MNRVLGLIFLVTAGALSAEERILDYHSDILVRADGWVEVTETIAVRAEGNQIRRGIFRDYPVRYRDRFGNTVKVLYEPKSAMRDGRPENFFVESSGSNVRTYFGSSNQLLNTGDYTYTYRYDAGRMLGFYENVDEFYWNVTGNEWAFPIDHASASVTFDFGVSSEDLVLAAYTGRVGQQGGDYTSAVSPSGAVRFDTTRPLALYEGLTIAVGWPKGLISEPGSLQKFTWLLSDNLNLVVVLTALLAMFSYYIPVWRSYGRDPQPGVIFPRYEPPKGFSPASLRYIENMGYDNDVMTSAIVSLGVKGYLRIDNFDDTHNLIRQNPPASAPALATGEQELHDALFKSGDEVELVDENHEIIGGARQKHEQALKRDYHKRYFRTNALLNLPPVMVAAIAAAIAFAIGPTVAVITVFFMIIVTIVVFAIVMKQPTVPGRKVMDSTAGFREYLEIAEKDELNLRNPPQKTPELFEQFLPFALALGVDQQWAERFSRIIANIKGPNGTEWQPSWYNGSWNSHSLSLNTSNLSSELGSAISTSVSPPGSSSGSGGGGFSGGGGGGGGGGGW
jgi:hypothetical protein